MFLDHKRIAHKMTWCIFNLCKVNTTSNRLNTLFISLQWCIKTFFIFFLWCFLWLALSMQFGNGKMPMIFTILWEDRGWVDRRGLWNKSSMVKRICLKYGKTNALTRFQIVNWSFVSSATLLSGKDVRKPADIVNKTN